MLGEIYLVSKEPVLQNLLDFLVVSIQYNKKIAALGPSKGTVQYGHFSQGHR